jgi:hypothetical protein
MQRCRLISDNVKKILVIRKAAKVKFSFATKNDKIPVNDKADL